MRKLTKTIRKLLHRRSPAVLRHGSPADVLTTSPIPVQPADQGQCRECWALPGDEHQLSCLQVSYAQWDAFLKQREADRSFSPAKRSAWGIIRRQHEKAGDPR